MTSSQLSQLQTVTVSTETDLATFWGALLGVGRFTRRTLWLAVLDDDGRPVPVAMPVDDIPQWPAEQHLDGLETVLTTIADYGSVVMLIARPGPEVVDEDDRSWAHALSPLAPRWPVHLATASHGRSRVQPIHLTS